ncbi:MAG: NAD(P)/FAD-dependent oxidoreductase, partial [Clostridiales bacterium]|nr:NAD(P)/FAD-dependent oxidoreductase [Clostridiales bacterium]
TNVELIMNSKVVKLSGSDKIESITVESTVDGSMQVLNVEGIFAAVGQEPNNAAFSELVDLDDAGFVIAGENCCTKQPNIFAAGDCRTKSVRQLVTAGADGGVSAIAACEYIDSNF